MRKPTRRSCKICKTKFTATYDNVWWCSPEHGFEYSQLLLARKKLDADRKRKQEAQQERRELNIRKAALKTKPQWKKEAQAAFNKYVRLRDAGLPCISCGSTPEQKFGGTMDCGHYRSRGAAAHLVVAH